MLVWLLSILLLTVSTNANATAIDICDSYKDAYKTAIERKIKTGVPFELMSVLLNGENVIIKRTIQVQYDLWDEVVTVKEASQLRKRFQLKDAGKELCKYLALVDFQQAQGDVFTFRLLLNPLWAGRIERLQGATQISRPGQVIKINWQDVAQSMPVEEILLTQVVK